jgi:hypothetical protein
MWNRDPEVTVAVVRIGTSAGIFHGLVTCLRVFRADSPCFHPSHSDTAGSAIDQRQRIQSTTPPSRSSVTPSNQTQPYTSSFLQPPCRPAHSSASSVACTKFATNKLIKACWGYVRQAAFKMRLAFNSKLWIPFRTCTGQAYRRYSAPQTSGLRSGYSTFFSTATSTARPTGPK